MTTKICLALIAIVFCVCFPCEAATHPNTKKIAKWEAKITKIQGKIDAENARTSSVAVVQYAVPVGVYVPAPAVEYVVPQPTVTYEMAPIVRSYSVRTYAAPSMSISVGAGRTWGQSYHAWRAWNHLRKAAAHASRS